MKIIFVTHGEAIENAQGIIMGQLIGGKLSSLGKLQAHKLGEQLKNTEIDSVYCSDLSRAIETANEILKYHKNLKLNLSKELRERDFGMYQGKRKDEIKELGEDWFSNETLGFEPIKDLCSRVERLLLKIEKQKKGKTVLLVGHRVCGVALECVIKQIPTSQFYTITEMKQGQSKTFDYPSALKLSGNAA